MKRLMLLAVFAAVSVGAAQGIPFKRTENVVGVKVGDRKRVAEDTLMFSEALVKYGLFQNYLHDWIDRPLLWDRAMRGRRFAYETPESFGVHLREARKYGMDGLGIFGTFGGRIRAFRNTLEWTRRKGPEGTQILPIAFFGESGSGFVPQADEYVELIKTAQASPFTPRIGGKVLIPSYNYRRFDLDTHRELSRKIREGVGNDGYILMGDLRMTVVSRLSKSFLSRGSLTDEERAELVSHIAATLDVADGLHLMSGQKVRDPTGPYCSHYDFSFLEKCLAPAVKEVLARPAYAGKIIGFYVSQGYINHQSGMNHGEFGTSTLRRAMSAVLGLNPDYLIFFEWNEVNENTMFQPTVYSGQTIGRLIRYYKNLLCDRPLETYPGDDPAVPSVVLSHPVVFKPGETVRFEVLNIPSGEACPAHDIRLELLGPAGERLVAFPQERLRTDVLGDITYSVPGGAFTAGTSVVPVLYVDGKRYEGFHPLRVDATSRWNYKEVRMALRDLAVPAKRGFTVNKTARPGKYAFDASLAFGENVASVELVCDEDEVAAYDVAGEYDRNANDIVRLAFTTRPGCGANAKVRIRLVDAEGTRLTQDWKANVNPGVIAPAGKDVWTLSTFFYSAATPYFAVVPKTRSATAVIEVDSTGAWNGRKVRIPVKTVLDRGAWSGVLSTENGFRVDVVRVDNLPDIPSRPGRNAVAWTGSVKSFRPAPSFHLRVITERGRIWRSAPALPVSVADGPVEDMAYFDEWTGRPARFKVASSLVPVLEYTFNPECGAAIVNPLRPCYNGTLGGGFHLGAMSTARALRGTKGGDFAPVWTDEDGRWLLRFDGTDDYFTLPIEAFPQNSFTVEAEFRPHLGANTMVLFRHSALWRASLCMFIRNGCLYGMWGDRDHDNPKRNTSRFDTGLKVRDREWNDLKVSYDFHHIAFTLNGETRRFPFDRRGYVFRPFIFGGHVVTTDISPDRRLDWFKGDLRRFAISHR